MVAKMMIRGAATSVHMMRFDIEYTSDKNGNEEMVRKRRSSTEIFEDEAWNSSLDCECSTTVTTMKFQIQVCDYRKTCEISASNVRRP